MVGPRPPGKSKKRMIGRQARRNSLWLLSAGRTARVVHVLTCVATGVCSDNLTLTLMDLDCVLSALPHGLKRLKISAARLLIGQWYERIGQRSDDWLVRGRCQRTSSRDSKRFPRRGDAPPILRLTPSLSLVSERVHERRADRWQTTSLDLRSTGDWEGDGLQICPLVLVLAGTSGVWALLTRPTRRQASSPTVSLREASASDLVRLLLQPRPMIRG